MITHGSYAMDIATLGVINYVKIDVLCLCYVFFFVYSFSLRTNTLQRTHEEVKSAIQFQSYTNRENQLTQAQFEKSMKNDFLGL